MTNEDFGYCNVAGCTDVGCKRAANEDNLCNFDCANGRVAVVCDGMGGHVGGATASRIAVNTIETFLTSQYFEDPREAIASAINQANIAILNEAEAHPELTGMGSTCVMLIVRGGKVYVGHVGDSRIYLIRERRIVQLTKDHSFVQMLVDMGQISKEEAEHHPRKNEITNALGIPNMQPPTVREDAIIPQAGDCFLLCSDGLSGMVSDDVICSVVSQQAMKSQQDRANILINKAKENGGLDNITVQLVEFSVTPGNISSPKWYTKPVYYIYILIACLIVGGGIFGGMKAIEHFKKKPATELAENDDKDASASEKTDTEVSGIKQRETETLDDCKLKTRPKNLFLVIENGFKIEVEEGRNRSTKFTYPKLKGIERDSVEIIQDLNYDSRWDDNGDYAVRLLDSYGEDRIGFKIKTKDKIYVVNCLWENKEVSAPQPPAAVKPKGNVDGKGGGSSSASTGGVEPTPGKGPDQGSGSGDIKPDSTKTSQKPGEEGKKPNPQENKPE